MTGSQPLPNKPTPKPQAKPFPWFESLLTGGVVFVAWKVYQEFTDEEYPGRTLPQSVRTRLLVDHYCEHGAFCHRCQTRTRLEDLEVDHIVSYRDGGRTSLQNSEIVCRPCNRGKGARTSIVDRIRGRGGR